MTETPQSEHVHPSNQDLGADGRHTPLGRPTDSGSRRKGILKKSTFYGILLFILTEFREELTDEQVAGIIYYSRKLSIAELLKAGKFSSQLLHEPVILRRTLPEIERIRRKQVPFLRTPHILEPRRIGIGYRDKGALRPRHRPRLVGERTFWDEDISWLLPLDFEPEGKWITADEVQSLIGNNLNDWLSSLTTIVQSRTLETLSYPSLRSSDQLE
jgi:hypothetical protein